MVLKLIIDNGIFRLSSINNKYISPLGLDIKYFVLDKMNYIKFVD